MRVPVKAEGFEKDTIEIEIGQIGVEPTLIVNGTPAIKDRSGNFVLFRDDGKEVTARFRIYGQSASVPNLEIDGKIYFTETPIKWYEFLLSILAAWPVFLGGIYVFLSVLAPLFNAWLIFTDYSHATKLKIFLLILALELLAWVIPAFVFEAFN